MAKAKKTTKTKKASKSFSLGVKGGKYQAVGGAKLKDKDIKSEREKSIGQHIGYRYDVNLIPDYKKLTPFLKKYIETMGWDDLNWLEDVHMGYEGDKPAVFDRNATLTSDDGKNCVLYSWYDNEFGYTKQVIRIAKYVTKVRRLIYY